MDIIKTTIGCESIYNMGEKHTFLSLQNQIMCVSLHYIIQSAKIAKKNDMPVIRVGRRCFFNKKR